MVKFGGRAFEVRLPLRSGHRTQADTDLVLEQPTTGEIAFVQVKSKAAQAVSVMASCNYSLTEPSEELRRHFFEETQF